MFTEWKRNSDKWNLGLIDSYFWLLKGNPRGLRNLYLGITIVSSN